MIPLCPLTYRLLTAAQIGEQITDDEMREMVAEADRSGTGRVGPDDFVHIVTSYAHHYDG